VPAGDLIAEDWQVEIRALLTGEGTDFELGEEGIGGLDDLVEGKDTGLGHADGVYLGRDYNEPRTLTFPYEITKPGDPSMAGSLYWGTLRPAWAKSEATNLELHFQLPGIGHLMAVGRPRGLMPDLRLQKHGLIRALATFYCGDPTLTVVA
jgi:hypothetical protein